MSILNKEETDTYSEEEEEETEDDEFLNVAQDNAQDSEHECNCQGAFCHGDHRSIRVLS